MAKNTNEGFRLGSVTNRSQLKNPVNGKFIKRNEDTGRFMKQKKDGTPFKGVAHEKDHRR